jgi:hypothetical protein
MSVQDCCRSGDGRGKGKVFVGCGEYGLPVCDTVCLEISWPLFILVSCAAYSLALKMEANVTPKRRTASELYSVTTQNTIYFVIMIMMKEIIIICV